MTGQLEFQTTPEYYAHPVDLDFDWTPEILLTSADSPGVGVVDFNGASTAIYPDSAPALDSPTTFIPNPVEAHAAIQFVVPRRAKATLRVYDVSGRLIRALYDGPLDPGSRSFAWDGRDQGARRVFAGTYF